MISDFCKFPCYKRYFSKKAKGYEKHFNLVDKYLKTRKELQVLYKTLLILRKRLTELKYILFTTKNERSYILKSGNSLEYNISTRRLNVIEPSVIEIIPPGEMPKKDKSSYLDIIIPTVLSTGGMLMARYLISGKETKITFIE